MTVPVAFQKYLGNQKVVEVLQRAIRQDRLPHAMIFAGPDGVGKRTLALLLARMLNCASPASEQPCEECLPCRKIRGGVHPDVREIKRDGAFIKIEQVREVVKEIAYQPFEAKTRVVIFDGADQMQLPAANSLLKTLEEPASRTVIVLLTTKPHALLTTIRSRSRILQFGAIPQDQVEEHLVRQYGRGREEARLAALFSQGSLGAAIAFDSGDYREARAKALAFARQLLGNGDFADASGLAAEITKDRKDRDGFLLWLEALAAVLQDAYYTFAAPGRVGQPDLQAELGQLASRSSRAAVVSALRAVQELRRSVNNNVNRQLALEALFLSETRGNR